MTINDDIRVVGFDLDGTLLKDDKTISERTRATLIRAMENGIYVLPATGRTWSSIPEQVKNIPGIQYGVCSNGAAVVDLETGEELYSCTIPIEEGIRLIEILESYHTMYDCYIGGRGYTEKRFYNNLDAYKVEPKIQEMMKATRNPVDNLLEEIIRLDQPIEKFNMFFTDLTERERAFKELSELPFVKVTSSLTNNLELNAVECNKGRAILEFASQKGFRESQVMCCGDGSNDYEMVRMCGVGVAMMNGEERVKEVADYITYTNEEDGVARAIERLCMRMQSFDMEER